MDCVLKQIIDIEVLNMQALHDICTYFHFIYLHLKLFHLLTGYTTLYNKAN